MLFTGFPFLLFLFITVIVFYILPCRLRKFWLLAASYYFYCSTDIRLILALIWITSSTFIGGYCIYKGHKKRLYFSIFFALNILVLFVFKYVPFCVRSLNYLTSMLGIDKALPVPNIFVPVGLSFMIFQSTTYLGDIFHGKMKPCGIIEYALFVAFFPSVLSGPIQKAYMLIPQFGFSKPSLERERERRIRKGILLILYGFCIKLYVSDVMDPIVDNVFDNWKSYSGLAYWIGGAAFSIQIYADFLSYSDIACGVANLFGIELTKNFRNPYLSRTLSEFWRNWHMSLNAWFAEYVYFPLGGSRKGAFRTKINKFTVFLLSGIWHGAAWHYIVWGLANGLLQLVGDSTEPIRNKFYGKMGIGKDSKIWAGVQTVCVFLMITTTWVFFRMPSTRASFQMIAGMYRPEVLVQVFNPNIWNLFAVDGFWLVPVLSVVLFILCQMGRRNGLYQKLSKEPIGFISILIAVCVIFIVVALCKNLAQPDSSFLYFEF